jgi:hypothetical protein
LRGSHRGLGRRPLGLGADAVDLGGLGVLPGPPLGTGQRLPGRGRHRPGEHPSPIDHRPLVAFEPAAHLAEPPFGPVQQPSLDHALFGGGQLAAQRGPCPAEEFEVAARIGAGHLHAERVAFP